MRAARGGAWCPERSRTLPAQGAGRSRVCNRRAGGVGRGVAAGDGPPGRRGTARTDTPMRVCRMFADLRNFAELKASFADAEAPRFESLAPYENMIER
jgi:class 3 adenylate cyclase